MDGFGDDYHYANVVARHIGVDLIEVESKWDIVRDFDAMVWHLDEPQADPAPLHVKNICRQARALGDIVLLGGTAGDDLFSGYRRHQALRFERIFQLCPGFLASFADYLLSFCDRRSPMVRRLSKISATLKLDSTSRLASYYQWLPLERNRSLFRPAAIESFRNRHPSTILLESLQCIPDEHRSLNQMLFWDLKFFLTDHNLNYTDKMSMAHGVEVRVPFLDLDLVKFACDLPIHSKMKGIQTKYLLKKVAERYLPTEVIYREKTGFGAPIRTWIVDGKMDPLFNRLVSGENEIFEQVFSSKSIELLLEETKSGKLDGSYALWSLLAIESWIRQFSKARLPTSV